MGDFNIRHLVERRGRYYFQPSKSMRKRGFCPETLGSDLAVAVERAEALNIEYDVSRHRVANTPARPSKNTVSGYIYDLERGPA